MNPGGREASFVIDLERLKFLHCGFGQFSLCLGRSLLPIARRAGLNPVVLTVPQGRDLLPEHDFLAAEWWRKTESLPWLKWLPRPREVNPAVWHATHQMAKFWPSDPRTPVLLTIHDLNFLREDPPEKIERALKKLQSKIDRCAAIAVISEFVRDEVREFMHVGDKPIRVIYNGADREERIRPTQPTVKPRGKYLLSIGSFAARKNFHTLIAMMEHLPDLELVIAGELTTLYGQRMVDFVRERGLTDRVHLPGIVTDGERQWLYENCEALVFPSLTEGFGLPVVEAMAESKPVVLSRKTSLPEIGGKDAFFWNDFNPQSMAQTVRNCLDAFAADPLMGRRLKRHASKFTWTSAAEQYVAWYQEIAEATTTRPKIRRQAA